MKIQENLVFNKYTGDMVGFVNLGDPDFSTFVSTDIMVTHVMINVRRSTENFHNFSRLIPEERDVQRIQRVLYNPGTKMWQSEQRCQGLYI